MTVCLCVAILHDSDAAGLLWVVQLDMQGWPTSGGNKGGNKKHDCWMIECTDAEKL